MVGVDRYKMTWVLMPGSAILRYCYVTYGELETVISAADGEQQHT